MQTQDYRVSLDAFEGPLDLLLFLIRRAEVDIHDIPIAAIADQYTRHLEGIERIDIDLAGEFLLMAATLMEIKARMLGGAALQTDPEAPAQDRPGRGDDADPRADLVRQLLAYKKYRDAASALEHRLEDWHRRFPAARAALDNDRFREALAEADELDPEDVNVVDLVEAFARICESVNFDRLGEVQVDYDDTPLEVHARDILEVLARRAGDSQPGLPLHALFRGRSRGEMIGLFLATLELVRQRKLAVRQDQPGGPITLSPADGNSSSDPVNPNEQPPA